MSAGGDMHRVIAALYKRRVAMNLSQEAVALKVGVSRAAICNWENCRGGITAENLFRWADALGMSITCDVKETADV